MAEGLLARAGSAGEVQPTHNGLVSEIGSAREVVSRQLSRSERSGLVTPARGKVTLLSRGALEHKAPGRQTPFG
ncbi:helix-turn-helix domain-containing protein [Hyphomonas sp.]|uniref:helix-turn-helix domain-containing protein n=1 Tax=Hyphomonas sp. TaxID=87 RepID=UPI0037BF61EE